jgi:hypothetical protein
LRSITQFPLQARQPFANNGVAGTSAHPPLFSAHILSLLASPVFLRRVGSLDSGHELRSATGSGPISRVRRLTEKSQIEQRTIDGSHSGDNKRAGSRPMVIFYRYLRHYWKLVAAALGLAAINQVFSLLDPLIFRHIIDSYATRYREYSSAQFLRGVSVLLGAAVGVAFVSRVAKNFQDYSLT